MRRPAARKIPGTHFCYRLSIPQGYSAAGRIKSIEKPSDLIVNRTRRPPACSIVPRSTTLPRATVNKCVNQKLHSFIRLVLLILKIKVDKNMWT
jgi:hypothetical protein